MRLVIGNTALRLGKDHDLLQLCLFPKLDFLFGFGQEPLDCITRLWHGGRGWYWRCRSRSRGHRGGCWFHWLDWLWCGFRWRSRNGWRFNRRLDWIHGRVHGWWRCIDICFFYHKDFNKEFFERPPRAKKTPWYSTLLKELKIKFSFLIFPCQKQKKNY